jgi:branched-chain amino acid transport system substrate-binding protein
MRLTGLAGYLAASIGAIVAATLGFGTPLHAQSKAPIKIGAVLSITGPAAGLGVNERNGAVVAAKEINAKGGIDGHPVELIVEDDTTNPDTAVSKVNDLIFNKGVVAILGGTSIAPTVAMGGITTKEKIPQFAFTGLGPPVEKSRTCVFHMFTPHALNARTMFEYARHIGAKRAAVLHDSGYGAVVMREIGKITADYPDIKIIDVEKYDITATDVSAQAAKIKAANPDVIFVIAVNAVAFRAIRGLQMTQPVVALNGASSYEIVSAMGDAADNIVFPEFVVYEDPLPGQKEFIAYVKKEIGARAKNAEAVAWDAMHVIANALKKAGVDARREKLCEAIRGPYKGVTTDYDFSAPDMTGIKLSGYIFSKLVHGQYTRLPFVIKE